MKLQSFLASLICLFSLNSFAVVNVEPNIVRIKMPGKVGKLIVTNTGIEAQNVQIYAKAWRQSPNGHDILEETTDVVAMPRVFKLAPGAEKRIFVALKTPRQSNKEVSYRLVIHQLVPRGSTESQIGIELKHSVPVFFKPARETMNWNVNSAQFVGRQLVVNTENNGNRHVMIASFNVKAKNSAGAVIWEKTSPGWYVKPGNKIGFELGQQPVEANDCLNVASIQLTAIPAGGEREAPADYSQPKVFNLPVTNDGCGQ